MFFSMHEKRSSGGYERILFTGLLAAICTTFLCLTADAQTPTPQSADSANTTLGGYRVTSALEFGWRWRSLDGSENKYRSDLNYRQGFRSFDTNILLQSESGKGKYFDSFLVTNSGWGADPSGYTRVNLEKTGAYKFTATVRRVTYFNNLSNHALNEHTQNTKHNFGDFDFTLLPQNELIRISFGASFSKNRGPGGWTARAYGDEFPVSSQTKTDSGDFRVGAEGKLLGFDWVLTQGFRRFKDRSYYELTAPHPGNNPVGTAALATFSRVFPTEGHAYYTQFNVNRTFAEKLDFTARVIYSSTNSRSSMMERITGRDASNNFIDLDKFEISAEAKRPQTRGDVGITYLATDKLRISNTFSLDKFTVNGGESFEELLFRRNAAGNPLATTLTRSAGYRVNDFIRFTNIIEGDYQFNKAVGFHIGYRYTHRKVDVIGFDQTLTSPPSATNPRLINEMEENSTNTLIAGMKLMPLKNWVIFWDVEHGQADNVFTRVENYKFTNFRVRTRVTANKVTFNFSAITKDNSNPSVSITVPANFNFVTDITSQNYSGSVTWDPVSTLSLGGGYTYRRLTSVTPVIFPVQLNVPPVTTVFNFGSSQFYVRDHYGYVEISARPHKRVSLFATYRMNKDNGQGDRISAVFANSSPNPNVPRDIIGSYPMDFKTPEFRAAFRISRNVDWNVGYQYYDYKDVQTPAQNYRAHLPYTSLRIYFGQGSQDR